MFPTEAIIAELSALTATVKAMAARRFVKVLMSTIEMKCDKGVGSGMKGAAEARETSIYVLESRSNLR